MVIAEFKRLAELDAPYLVEITVDLAKNWIGILDTGIGMTLAEVTSAFAPHVSFKQQSPVKTKRDKKACIADIKV